MRQGLRCKSKTNEVNYNTELELHANEQLRSIRFEPRIASIVYHRTAAIRAGGYGRWVDNVPVVHTHCAGVQSTNSETRLALQFTCTQHSGIHSFKHITCAEVLDIGHYYSLFHRFA